MDFFSQELERDALKSFKKKYIEPRQPGIDYYLQAISNKLWGPKDPKEEADPAQFMGGEPASYLDQIRTDPLKDRAKHSQRGFYSFIIRKTQGFGEKTKFSQLSPEKKQERLDELWNIVRLYCKEVMLKARFKKLEEQTMKDNTFEFEEENHEEIEKEEDEDYQPRWYLIEKDGKPCQFWDFMITCIIIYNLFVTPFVLVFPEVY